MFCMHFHQNEMILNMGVFFMDMVGTNKRDTKSHKNSSYMINSKYSLILIGNIFRHYLKTIHL